MAIWWVFRLKYTATIIRPRLNALITRRFVKSEAIASMLDFHKNCLNSCCNEIKSQANERLVHGKWLKWQYLHQISIRKFETRSVFEIAAFSHQTQFLVIFKHETTSTGNEPWILIKTFRCTEKAKQWQWISNIFQMAQFFFLHKFQSHSHSFYV